MPNVSVFDVNGKKVSELMLADGIFGIEPNTSAMHLVVVNYLANQRQGTQSTLTRAEVSGGGIKPWRQKGTGRARQGSTRATQWVGGGIAFGPKPRNYSYKLNRKVRRLALRSALSEKLAVANLVVVENVKFDAIKTKEFVKVMNAFELETKTLFVVDVEEDFDNAFLSMRNIPNAMMLTVDGLNTFDIVNADKIVFTEAAAVKAGEVWA